MRSDFPPRPKPEVKIEWFSHVRRPLEWSLGTEYLFSYSQSSLQARDLGKKPIFVTEVGIPVTFKAKQTFQETERFPVFWEWNFGDGLKGYGQEVQHVWSLAYPKGTQVVLTVTDNKGAKWRTREPMYIEPPTITPVLIDPKFILQISDYDPPETAPSENPPSKLL